MLAHQGLADRARLTQLTDAWRGLLREINPDLIVSDFSPLLNLAARGKAPIVVIGNGYTIPPNDRTLPPIAPWIERVPAESAEHEQEFLDSANAIPRARGVAPITYVGELFHGDRSFICTFPEFDPYQKRAPRQHHTPFNIPSFPPPVPLAEKPHGEVFIYLPGDHPSLPVVLGVLATLGRQACLFAPGIDTTLRGSALQLGHQVVETPVDLSDVLFRMGLVVHHSGLALAHAALLAGLPQLLLPLGLEHAVTAWGARRFGACAALFGKMQIDKEALLTACSILLTDVNAQQTAYQASRVLSQRQENTRQVIIDMCHSMITQQIDKSNLLL